MTGQVCVTHTVPPLHNSETATTEQHFLKNLQLFKNQPVLTSKTTHKAARQRPVGCDKLWPVTFKVLDH